MRIAFLRFREVLTQYRACDDRLGEQATLFYLARTAAAASKFDRAVVVAGDSLVVGREIHDGLGMSINLNLLLNCFSNLNDEWGLVATTLSLQRLAMELRDAPTLQDMAGLAAQLRGVLPTSLFEAIAAAPDFALQQSIDAARQRLAEQGVDSYEPWQEEA